jgi:hypothetical protein
MGIEYNAASLQKAIDLCKQQEKIRNSVAGLLSKVKDGYFNGKQVVLKSGLKKADVEKILDAHKDSVDLTKQITALEKTFNSELTKAMNEEKKQLETRLKNLEDEYEKELKKFPSARDVVGPGPAQDFREALKDME